MVQTDEVEDHTPAVAVVAAVAATAGKRKRKTAPPRLAAVLYSIAFNCKIKITGSKFNAFKI